MLARWVPGVWRQFKPPKTIGEYLSVIGHWKYHLQTMGINRQDWTCDLHWIYWWFHPKPDWKATNIKKHQFIHDQQTKYFYSLKENLSHGNVLVVGDFSQNYSFIYQDIVQGVHCSNTSCTLHPWMCYYRGQNDNIQCYPLLFISDCLTHETVSVYAFQSVLIRRLKEKFHEEKLTLTQILYHTDGCSRQYKNKKNFLNLTYH